MKLLPSRPFVSLVWGLSFVVALAGTPRVTFGQSQTETKIRLMADALRARDDGDLEAALRNLTELNEMAPGDPAVMRLLTTVERDLQAEIDLLNRGEHSPEVAPVSVEEPPVPVGLRAELVDVAELEGVFGNDGVNARSFEPEIEALAREEELRQAALLEQAIASRDTVRELSREQRFAEAASVLNVAIDSLPENPATRDVLGHLRAQLLDVRLAEAEYRLGESDFDGAENALAEYYREGGEQRSGGRLSARIVQARREAEAPVRVAIQTAAPEVSVTPDYGPSVTEELWERARVEYAAARWGEAERALNQLLAMEPDHSAAQRMLRRVHDEQLNLAVDVRATTRGQLVEEVDLAWRRPEVLQAPDSESGYAAVGSSPLLDKLNGIQIPSVSFSSVELQRVVATLSELSSEFDPSPGGIKGINILVIDPQDRRPTVSLTLRNLSLKRVLDFITDSVGYQYEVQPDAVVVRPGGETSTLDTEFFPITRSTVIRMTGIGGGLASGGATGAASDPFSPAPVASSTIGGGGESDALQRFLQQAGVDFESTPGSSLAYDGSAMIVTQTSRNIERIRNILNRYNDVRQVEIEAKFMEVQEGALEELGVQWGVTHGINGDPNYLASGQTGNRSLNSAFTNTIAGTTGRIVNAGRDSEVFESSTGRIEVIPGQNPIDLSIPNNPAQLPRDIDLAADAGALASIDGLVGEFNVNAVIRALSRQEGSDLLSAPKVTVLSGNPATITVAQELRFPTSYGEVRSEVGSSSREGSSAGVTITAGTPRDFETRKVGVELRVTPTVEEDDYSISLDLNPKVTEFEGFVEFGGQSVAISGGTTVTVPSGFYQPIFSTREVSTKVTLWDGATLVMGGLTREEVKTVNDKVPILGDIPGLGRLFRSQGETSQKRNLLIFVTANLVSPGGSPKKQSLDGVASSSAYQNPTLVTPGGAARRTRE